MFMNQSIVESNMASQSPSVIIFSTANLVLRPNADCAD